MHNAKSREHAHTCRKARAILKLRYKKKIKKNQLSGSVVLTQLPGRLEKLYLARNKFSGSLDLTQLPPHMSNLFLNNNSFSGRVDLSQLPRGLVRLYLSDNELSGEAFLSDELFDRVHVVDTTVIKRHME